MSPRIRKLIGTVAMLAFLFGWVVAAIAIADHLPEHPAIELIYFLVVGTAWGIPLFPLMTWMNREPPTKG